MNIPDRIKALREAMNSRGIDAYIIPSTDPHQGEYIPDYWQSRQWLSGFTGSAGTLVVTSFFAGVWTDSRYFIQAEEELKETGIDLVKLVVPHTPEFIDWILMNLPKGSKVGVDSRVISASLYDMLQKTFQSKDIKLEGKYDLLEEIWVGRPLLPKDPVFEYDTKYAGKSRREKLEQIRSVMSQKQAQYHLICSLDDIAWTLNLRGSDVVFNPVFVSYLLLGEKGGFLYIMEEKISESLRIKLEQDGIKAISYAELEKSLPKIISGKKVLLQSAKSNEWISQLIRKHAIPVEGQNVPVLLKAVKNEVEIQHTRKVMEKDGVALLRFFMWLEKEVSEGNDINEFDCGEKIAEFRREMKYYMGESFSPIVGYAGHGAIVHYSASPEKAYKLKPEGILLIDSGGQYLDGTTDITRTISLGKPAKEQIKHFTLVLKGHIALATAIFPYGTKGFHLDILARKELWQNQLNYGHGTGHGVGFFLNVHEGPQGISPNPVVNQVFEPGMITSNEPGLYIEDQYGIRIENLILSVELPDQGTGRFLGFETLSLFPIDLNLVDITMLDQKEIDWLNHYHSFVYNRLSEYLDETEKSWLKSKTNMI
jgi:Xaa-Pro aminopeptidase